jgi:tetrahydromethanopterin S-methyltransferase subunit F
VNEDLDTARDDLAFLRALVSEGGQAQGSVGGGLLAGGLCYGLQCIAQWGLLVSGWQAPPLLGLAVGVLPTVVFLAILAHLIIRDRKISHNGVGTRAMNAAFGGAGLAAMTTTFIFGYLAVRQQSLMIWLFHPMMICVVQGTVWYIAYAIRRRGWIGLVSGGWFATALVLTLLIGAHWFVLLLGFSLLLLMALPGWLLVRTGPARR